MQRQSKMAHIGIVYQTTFDHKPTKKSLKTAQTEKNKAFFQGAFIQFFSNQKINERYNKYQSNGAPYEAMKPFPKINIFVIRKCKIIMNIDFLIFWKLFVLFKSFFPFGFRKRWKCIGNQMPIGHGKSRIC